MSSWFFNPDLPFNQRLFPTQATAFGSSSLASASASVIAYDGGKQEYRIVPQTAGNRMVNGLSIVSEDKSALGLSVRERAAALQFTAKDPKALTVPNKYSLSRNTLL